jgi:hypothetical protein
VSLHETGCINIAEETPELSTASRMNISQDVHPFAQAKDHLFRSSCHFAVFTLRNPGSSPKLCPLVAKTKRGIVRPNWAQYIQIHKEK